MVKFAAIWLVVLAAGCSAPELGSQPGGRPLPSPGIDACSREVTEPQRISIAALVANPERFEGKPVFVIGYYRSGFEHSAVYLHQEDAAHSITANGLWLQADVPNDLRNGYIGVDGIFTGLARGHLGQWSGTLCGVSRVVPWGSDAP
jgi:hypothetical protein